MRELVNQTVTSALLKEQSRKNLSAADEDKGASAAQTKFYEQRIEQYEAEIESLKNEKKGAA